MELSAEEVLQEVQAIDGHVVEMAVLRVLNRRQAKKIEQLEGKLSKRSTPTLPDTQTSDVVD